MRCQSCNALIPSEWVHAISSNVCPGCSGAIMPEETKTLMDELASAMQKMPNDPQGVSGWLLSNYHFQKIGTEAPVEKFHRKAVIEKFQNQDIPSNLKVDSSYEQFLKRTDMHNRVTGPNQSIEMAKAVKNGNGKIAAMAQQILDDDDLYGQENPSNISTHKPVANMPISPEDLRAYNEMKASGEDPFLGSDMGGMISSANLMRVAKENNSSDVSVQANALSKLIGGELAAGLDEEGFIPAEQAIAGSSQGLAVIQQQRYKRLKAQDAVTGGAGPFRR